MPDTPTPTTSRTAFEPTAPESSPSAGWRETAASMHTVPGLGRRADREGEPLEVVDADDDTDAVLREGVRCSDHAKDFLEVTS